MFHTLHRLYVMTWVVLIIGGMVWLYPRTGISEPLMDWYAVWQNEPGPRVKPVAELSGTAVRVNDGTSFVLRTVDRETYTMGLLGVLPVEPTPKPGAPPTDLAKQSREFLSELLLSNEVQVAATFLDPQRRGVGVVHLGKTNVNAAVVASGHGKLKRDYIKGLSWQDQYQLLRADRKMREFNPDSVTADVSRR
jgi:endonuclease YncB( thermonuclease family)